MNLKVFADDLRFLGYTLLHPFDGFYELRFRRTRNWFLVAFVYALCGIVEIIKTHYSGFLVSEGSSVYGVNNWYVFVTALFPYFLFAVANWSITTLFNGNGSLADVVMVMAYALVPRLFLDIVYIIASNFIISEELILLYALYIIGIIFFCFFVFAGLCVVHEYSVAENIITIIATAAATVIIMFIGMLYLEIMGKIIGFVTTVATELMKRR
jgi:hypothetical protein